MMQKPKRVMGGFSRWWKEIQPKKLTLDQEAYRNALKEPFRRCWGNAFIAGWVKGYQSRKDGERAIREFNRDSLALYAHEAWSGWMRYMFGKCEIMLDGSATVPRDLVQRWQRQSETPYSYLPPNEQASDLQEADKILALLGAKPLRVRLDRIGYELCKLAAPHICHADWCDRRCDEFSEDELQDGGCVRCRVNSYISAEEL